MSEDKFDILLYRCVYKTDNKFEFKLKDAPSYYMFICFGGSYHHL